MYRGVIDRIKEGKAVILVEGQEYIIEKHILPGEVKEGDWLKLEFYNKEIISIVLDKEYTDDARKRIEEKHQKLKQKQNSKFKKE